MSKTEKIELDEQSFLDSGRVRYISRLFQINHWSETSKGLVFLALPGLIFFILNLFAVIPYVWNWFYLLTAILLLGFLFRSYDQSYNFLPVLLIFLFLLFIPTNSFQMILSFLAQESEQGSDVNIAKEFEDSLDNLNNNPLTNARAFALNFIDVLNWVTFIAMIAIGGSTIGDFISGDWGKIAQKGATIAVAVAIMTFIYSIMQLAIDDSVRTIWDTVGSAWKDLLEGVGLAQLDQNGDTTLNARTVTNGIFRWIPLSFPFILLVSAYFLRDTDVRSIMFVRSATDTKKIEVNTRQLENISMYMLLGGILLIIIYVGYFLTTAEQTINMNPLIILAFFSSSLFVIILLMFNLIIVVRMDSLPQELWRIIKYTFAGMMMLYLWFQIAQPVFYQMNLIDTPNAQMTFSQSGDFLDNKIIEQAFMVATPETLIFQIAIIGAGNAIYYRLRRGTILTAERNKIKGEYTDLTERIEAIDIKSGSISKSNLRRITRKLALMQKRNKLEQKMDTEKDLVSIRYFIIPTIISAVIGSFLFSLWHSFRRGMSFWIWWQNPLFGMVYWGAGMILSAIAFFCPIAAILVHFLNNFITLIMAGAL
ncbi:MAG: hypothetical protein KGY74_07095 [Candidatus Cloacimonetes bacterium]|nr:hypothetical protein [Candidatus Cloacimonadota bacterium]